MDISVVIPSSGNEESLIRCLRSIERDNSFSSEICVVDDGGGMNCGRVRSSLDHEFPLVWQAFDRNRGRSAARNEGITSTSGKVVVFLDDDMETSPGFLGAHLRHHLNTPHTAAIGAITWPTGGSFMRYIGSRGINKLAPTDTIPPHYFVTGNSSIMRNDLPSERPFDESLSGWGGEDLDLGLTLRNNGIGFAYVPEASALHHFSGTLRNHIKRLESYGAESMPVLTARHAELMVTLRLNMLRTVFCRAAIHPIPAQTIERCAELFDGIYVPDLVFNYLAFAAYGRGWLSRRDTI